MTSKISYVTLPHGDVTLEKVIQAFEEDRLYPVQRDSETFGDYVSCFSLSGDAPSAPSAPSEMGLDTYEDD